MNARPTGKRLIAETTMVFAIYLLLHWKKLSHGSGTADILCGALAAAIGSAIGFNLNNLSKIRYLCIFLATLAVGVVFQWHRSMHGASFNGIVLASLTPAIVITAGFALFELLLGKDSGEIQIWQDKDAIR